MGDELGWDDARRRARGGGLPRGGRRRRHPARVVRSAGTFGPSPVGRERSPSTWSRFATPSDRPAHRRLRPRARARRARGLVPRRSRSTARTPTSSRSATSTSPATAPARVSYLRAGDGVAQAYVSRIFGGGWQPPERVSFAARRRRPRSRSPRATATGSRSPGSPTATSTPRSARAADRPAASCRRSQLGGPGAHDLDVDLGVNGAAYAIWEEGGNVARRPPAGRDVDAASRRRWTSTRRARPGPARCGRASRSRPRATRSRPGARSLPDGARTCTARRHHRHEPVDGPAGPQCAGGGNADSPDIDIEDDGSYAWIVFRQDIGGVSRTIGRRLVGSQYEAPEFIDAGVPSRRAEGRHERRRRRATPSRRRRSARRSSAPGSTTTTSRPRRGSTASTASRRPSRRSPATDQADIAIAWRLTGADGTRSCASATTTARTPTARSAARSRSRAAISARSSTPACRSAPTASGDVAVAMVQGTPGAKTLAVAIYDRPPGAPFIDDDRGLQAQDPPRAALAAGQRPVGRADVPRLHGRRPDRPDDGVDARAGDAADDRQAHLAGRVGRSRGADRAQPRPDAEDRRHAADPEGQGRRASARPARR